MTTPRYPSLPVPTNTITSMYNFCLGVRQILSLLIMNAQTPQTNYDLTQASQIFATSAAHETLNQTVIISSADLTDLTNSIDILVETQVVTQSGASLTINRSLGENCTLSVTGSITSVAVSNWPAIGTMGKIFLIVNNTGAFTMSGWPAGTIWPSGTAPVLTPSGKDLILLFSVDAGATIFGSVVGQSYS